MPPSTYALGLIGYPLGHSLSPQIHGTALHALRIDGQYSLYPVPPYPKGDPLSSFSTPREREACAGLAGELHVEGEEQLTLDGLIAQMRTGDIHGLNVTIPHKQNVIPLLDKLTPAAEAIGAVNTIFVRDEKLVGDNTDAPGFWRDLQQLVKGGFWRGDRGKHSTGRMSSALVLGAGGSARAVAYALLTHGYHVTIFARRLEQAQALCNQLTMISHQLSVLDSVHRSEIMDSYSLLVNTTPVGMYPHEDASPWPADVPLPKVGAVYDLVYNPRETLLVRRAREIGLPAITGLGMLIEQAALAFERWTGMEAPRKAMMEAVI